MSVCRPVSEILSVKEWRDSETGGRGRSRSLKMAPFDRSYTTFYWSVIVTIALCCTIFELFDVESSWPWNLGYKLLKVIQTGSVVSYSPSIVTIAVSLTVYEIFSGREYSVILKTGLRVVQDHWKWRRSIEHIRLYIGPPL